MRVLSLAPAALAAAGALSPFASAQRLVSLDGLAPPSLTAIPAAPAVTPPICFPGLAPCLLPPLLPFPPGIAPPSVGGEAIDEATGTFFATDGIAVMLAGAYPGCVIALPIPLAAWPPGPCGPIGGAGAAPIVAMCDAAAPGAIWVLNAAGLVSLIPVVPGPPLAQGIAPPAVLAFPTGITFDPTTGLLWFTGAGVPAVVSALAPPVGAFVCAPLPAGPVFPIPACLPPPFIGVTLNTALLPGAVPALTVSNGIVTADILTGVCPCPVLPPAFSPPTDIDFADVPWIYGVGCGCGPPAIGFAGGLPVLGNAAFTITATGVGPGVGFGALFLSGVPVPAGIPFAPPCSLYLLPPVVFLPPVVPVVPAGPPPCPGSAAYPLPVPAGPPGIVGVSVYLQWAFFPAIPPPGFEVSNALEVTVGIP